MSLLLDSGGGAAQPGGADSRKGGAASAQGAEHGDASADPIARVQALSGQNIWACYQCGKCTADCPFSLTPNLVLRMLQLGEIDHARTLATTWDCASCYTCAVACPKGVNPARIMKALRSLGPPPASALAPRDGHAALAVLDSFPLTRGLQARAPLLGRLRAWLQQWRAHRMAEMPGVLALGSRFAPLSGWLARLPGAAWVNQLVLGIHHKRPVPPFAKPSFPEWFRTHTPLGHGQRGPLLLFHDTFMDFSFPQVGVAATELLELAGFKVDLTDSVCCGRPKISKGFMDEAAVCAKRNVGGLCRAARAGVPIVGTEPSCLLSLRDEYPHLVGDAQQDDATAVARQAFLVDEFLLDLHGKGQLDLRFRADGERAPILFHGHCHQKAFADAGKSLAMLALAGYRAEMVNAACCGMAGAHGFEKQHYAASQAAGEKALFPALRARPDAGIVVMGVSCRQQIEHFTGRPVRHLVEALREAVQE
jgi:Fe-S oxidoreductase